MSEKCLHAWWRTVYSSSIRKSGCRPHAIKNLIGLSKEKTPSGAAAARYLADEGYIPKKIGRITKEEKVRQTKIAAGIRDDLKSDMERLGIELITGTKG